MARLVSSAVSVAVQLKVSDERVGYERTGGTVLRRSDCVDA